ncbi:MAG: hypothetical protein J2P28_04005 [Actinobacteria bacterium]|nr:hypothetical protein [Actinomycetota bacterium]
MPGASERTRQVTTVNLNWITGADDAPGRFEVMLITDDGEQHFASASAGEMSALIALTQAPTVLLWDPADQTLIAANLRGRMPWTDKLEHPAGG